jgi:hypothetical protein
MTDDDALTALAGRVDEAIELVATLARDVHDLAEHPAAAEQDAIVTSLRSTIARLRGLGSEAPTGAPFAVVGDAADQVERIRAAGSGAPTPTEGPPHEHHPKGGSIGQIVGGGRDWPEGTHVWRCRCGSVVTQPRDSGGDACDVVEPWEWGAFGPAVAAAPTEAPAGCPKPGCTLGAGHWPPCVLAAEYVEQMLARETEAAAGSPGTPEEPAERSEAPEGLDAGRRRSPVRRGLVPLQRSDRMDGSG